jgi:hypothetical protein
MSELTNAQIGAKLVEHLTAQFGTDLVCLGNNILARNACNFQPNNSDQLNKVKK